MCVSEDGSFEQKILKCVATTDNTHFTSTLSTSSPASLKYLRATIIYGYKF